MREMAAGAEIVYELYSRLISVRSIGSTTSKRRLCNLFSMGKFGRGEAEAKRINRITSEST